MEEAELPTAEAQHIAGAKAAESMDLIRIVSILWGSRWAIILGGMGAAITALLLSFWASKVYESTATIMVLAPRFSESSASSSLQLEDSRLAKSYEAIVKTDGALIATMEEFQLGGSPSNLTLQRFRSRVAVESVRDSNLLRVRVEMNDPDLAASVANFIAERTVDMNRRMSTESLVRSRKFIQEEVSRGEEDLKDAEEALTNFRSDNAIELMKEELAARALLHTDLRTREADTAIKLAEARGVRESAEETLGSVPKILKTIRGVVDDVAYQELLSRQHGSDAKALLTIRMESEEINPTYLSLENTLASARTGERGYASQRQQIASVMEKNNEELKALNAELVVKEAVLARLMRASELARESYIKLSTALSSANIQVMSKSGEVTVVDPAQPPARHIRPRKAINTIVAGAFGCLLMAAVVLLSEFFRNAGGLDRISGQRA